ncbi:hypothetical protein ACJX0J_020793, partial [Zea mays]
QNITVNQHIFFYWKSHGPILWDYFMSRKESISLGFEDEKIYKQIYYQKFCTSPPKNAKNWQYSNELDNMRPIRYFVSLQKYLFSSRFQIIFIKNNHGKAKVQSRPDRQL